MSRWIARLAQLRGSSTGLSAETVQSCSNCSIVQNGSLPPGFEQLNKLNSETAQPDLDSEDLRDRYEERAAISEYEGGLDRANAEAVAWEEVAAIWYRFHGTPAPHSLCAGCGQPLTDSSNVFLLPHGERAHTGTGNSCIMRYTDRWKRQASAALATIDIPCGSEILKRRPEPTNT